MTFRADIITALQNLPAPVKQKLAALKPRIDPDSPDPITIPDVADYIIRRFKSDVEAELNEVRPRESLSI